MTLEHRDQVICREEESVESSSEEVSPGSSVDSVSGSVSVSIGFVVSDAEVVCCSVDSSGTVVVSFGFLVVSFVVVSVSAVVSFGTAEVVSAGFEVSGGTVSGAVTVRMIVTVALLPSKSVTENVTG